MRMDTRNGDQQFDPDAMSEGDQQENARYAKHRLKRPLRNTKYMYVLCPSHQIPCQYVFDTKDSRPLERGCSKPPVM